MPKAPPIEIKSQYYDKLKPLVQMVLPAAGALYFALSQIWGFPAAEEVVGTIAAITTFLGVILGISSKNYNEHKDGSFVIDETDVERDYFTLELDLPLEDIYGRKEMRFQVRNDSQD